MNDKLDKAVINNIEWCSIVCESHGISHTSRDFFWGVQSKAPKYYPELISISRNATFEGIQDFIENGDVSSIKDSYGNLELTSLGFKILFHADWIYHLPVRMIESPPSKWRLITTEEELAVWTLNSGLEDVIIPELLRDNNVKVFMYENKDEVSGFIVNASRDVVGVSNVFSNGSCNESIWKEIPELISSHFPGISMVGYEHGENLISAKLSGWSSIGPLRVWIKADE